MGYILLTLRLMDAALAIILAIVTIQYRRELAELARDHSEK